MLEFLLVLAEVKYFLLHHTILTGFLKDKPLAKLRNDMKEIGIELAENVKEPEDHIASLFDMMSGLILGKFQ
jgi:TorA maturation chaperone TorD